MSLFRHSAVFAAIFVAVGASSPVYAIEAYWHGVRSNNWNGGIVGGQSNWYSEPPPNGVAKPVPTNEAIFTKGAKQFHLVISDDTVINDITFLPASPRYTFNVKKTFEVAGGGVDNRSPKIPFFDINGTMSFTHEANSGKADYQTEEGGTLDYSADQGPLKGFEEIANSIVNKGSLNTGFNRLSIDHSFIQQAKGVLQIDVSKPHAGSIIADVVSLSGTLVVEGRPDVVAGKRLLVRGQSTLAGKFKRVVLFRFPDTLRATIEYSGKDVNLVLTAS